MSYKRPIRRWILCRRCGERCRHGRKSLCRRCWLAHRHEYDNAIGNERAWQADYRPVLPLAPTHFIPGMLGKCRVLEARCLAGLKLWHEAGPSPRPSVTTPSSPAARTSLSPSGGLTSPTSSAGSWPASRRSTRPRTPACGGRAGRVTVRATRGLWCATRTAAAVRSMWRGSQTPSPMGRSHAAASCGTGAAARRVDGPVTSSGATMPPTWPTAWPGVATGRGSSPTAD